MIEIINFIANKLWIIIRIFEKNMLQFCGELILIDFYEKHNSF